MKILAIAPNWVGDMVMAQVLFKALKKLYGADTIIDVVSQRWALSVASRMDEVRNLIEMKIAHGEFGLKKRYALGKLLRAENYDLAIVMTITFKSALIPFFAKIPIRAGHLGEIRFGLINDIKKIAIKRPRMIDKYMSLCDQGDREIAIEYPKLRVDLENQKSLLARLGLNVDKPIAALFVGAEYGEAKRYSIGKFAVIANKLIENGCQIWVFGSERDRSLGEELLLDSPKSVNLCGKTSLTDAIDLIALAKFAISNDSGLLHIAAAVGINVIAIYGSSTSDYTPPLTDKKEIVSLNLPCSPCFKKRCPLKHLKCLRDLPPEMILERVKN
ncbi:MAG: lipopolysaccharide heptosyltransferase II [Helicobacteraceae bacterium]|jgi:heptosyltransferase-2|nr:lipopolysaccharide heptosyltransferase II [Helicobacteraceae bacterium]